MFTTQILLDFFSSHFPNWGWNDVHLEWKERTLKIVCPSVESQRKIVGDSSTLSHLDIGIDLFLISCTGYPTLGIHRAHGN
jgi:hypothetical protein